MKILNLHAENIKRIKVVDITPDKDGVVVVEGKNSQGKTSVLDCILFTLCGEKMIPDNVIRTGETEGIVKIELDDVIITRTFKEGGTTKLTIDNKSDSSRIMAPQTWLDARLGKLSFDPLAFARLDKKDRLEQVKKITGLNFSEIESAYGIAFEKRKLANRDVETFTEQLKAFADFKLPEKERFVSEVRDDMRTQEAARNRETELKTKLMTNENALKYNAERVKSLRAEIQKLEKTIDDYESSSASVEISIREIKASLAELPALVDYSAEFDRALAYEKAKEKFLQKETLASNLGAANTKVKTLETEMSELKNKKSSMIQSAKMPVDGLSMTKDDVTFDGIAFDEISDAQKIRVSMAIAVSQNPTIKIVRIKEGSLLDKDMFNAVVEFAKEKDFQVWIERVADASSKNAIFIENGEVVAK